MKIALIGLPGSGKTTVFNALTGAGVDLHAGGRAGTHRVVHLEDGRVDRLAEMASSKKKGYAAIEYVDLGALGKDGRQMDDQFLAGVRGADAVLLVIRAFPEGPGAPVPDAVAEWESVYVDLMVADLQVVEGRLARLNVDIQKGTKELLPERDLLIRCRETLEAEKPIRVLEFTEEEDKMLRGYAFLSAKPLLVLFNTGEESREFALPPDQESGFKQPKVAWTSFCAELEAEVLSMGDEADEFAREMGVESFSRDRIIPMCYDLLGLITFLTMNETESRAWPIRKGSIALRAAGTVHSDIERGFIRAETISYDDLIGVGSWSEARTQGRLRQEGKEYIVQEGDVILFRFKV